MKICFLGSYIFLSLENKQRLLENGITPFFIDETPSMEIIAKASKEYEFIATYGKLNLETVMHFESLKMIVLMSTGFEELIDQISLNVLRSRKIRISYTPHYSTKAVSEYALSIALAMLRKIFIARNYKIEKILDLKKIQGRSISNCQSAIIGMGAIGQNLAESLNFFGSKIISYTANPHNKRKLPYDIKYVELKDLATNSDLIFVTCSLNDSTIGMIDKNFLELLKENVCLINVARADIYKPEDLYDFLIKNPNSSAFCDDKKNGEIWDKLRKLDNYIETPHIAFNTQEALLACTNVVVDNVISYLKNENLNVL